MKAKEKAKELFDKYDKAVNTISYNPIKQCALIAVENEFNSLRNQLFNLRSCKVIENEKTYLKRIDILIKEEKEVKEEINKL